MKFSPESAKASHEAGAVPTPQELQNFIETLRILADPKFERAYTEYKRDMERVANKKARYEVQSTDIALGKSAEALILFLFGEGRVGELLKVRAANLYDDYFNGVDAVIEQKRGGAPTLATIDITINQEDIKGKGRVGDDAGEKRPVGLEAKLARVKEHIDALAVYSDKKAQALYDWMENGGLHEPRTNKNDSFFKDAEKIILLKYYETSDASYDPMKPYVIGGPKVVVSIDTVFVNQALQGNEHAKGVIQALSFLEFAYGVHVEHEYLKKKRREIQNENPFFREHCEKVEAWGQILEQPAFQELVVDFSKAFKNDPEFRSQLAYYSQTLSKVFGV